MKKSILLVYLMLCGTSVFAQGGWEVKGYFGVSGTTVGPKEEFIGSASISMEDFKEFGILLSKELEKNFSISTGIGYSYSTVQLTMPPCGGCYWGLIAHNSDFEMLSIPIYAEYSFWKYLYAAAGTSIDFQQSEFNNFSDQSGVGYLVGLGGKMQTEKFSFSVFPNYKRHAAIPFEKPEGAKDILQEFGIQLGVGYRF